MSETLTIDDLTFEMRRSSRRKTVEITVDRGGELIVAAPDSLDEVSITRFVHDRREWVYRKLAEKEIYQKPRPCKEFVTGEGFYYLGRNYRLKLVDEQDRPLKLTGGRFRLRRTDAGKARAHFIGWYARHGEAWIARRISGWEERLGVETSGIRVLDLGHRWGSCSPSGAVNVHWTTMQIPASIVDYILVHELAHLLEPRHGQTFWHLVERTMPDFESRRRWLAEHGQAYAGL